MSTIEKPRLPLAELTTEQPESTEPDYLKWKEAKIRQSRADAHRNPKKLVSHAEMRQRLGLEH